MELRWPPRDPADGPDEPRLDGSPPSHKVIVAGTRIEVDDRVEYSRLRPSEVLTYIYAGPCKTLHESQERKERLPTVGGEPYIELFKGTRVGDRFEVPVRIGLFLRDNDGGGGGGGDGGDGDYESMRHAVCKLRTAVHKLAEDILEFDAARKKVEAAHSKTYMRRLRRMIAKKVETHADSEDDRDSNSSDSDSGDEYDGEYDGEEEAARRPRQQRRRLFSEMGLQRDTNQQQVDLLGIEVRPARGLRDPARREVHGETDAHIAELLVAITETGARPSPQLSAAHFTSGAEVKFVDGECVYVPPEGDLACDVVVTARMLQDKRDRTLYKRYLKTHEAVYKLKARLHEIFASIRTTFTTRIIVGHDGRVAVGHVHSPAVRRGVALMLFKAMLKGKGEGAESDENSDSGSETTCDGDGSDGGDGYGSDGSDCDSDGDDSDGDGDDSDSDASYEPEDSDDDDDNEAGKKRKRDSESDSDAESESESESE